MAYTLSIFMLLVLLANTLAQTMAARRNKNDSTVDHVATDDDAAEGEAPTGGYAPYARVGQAYVKVGEAYAKVGEASAAEAEDARQATDSSRDPAGRLAFAMPVPEPPGPPPRPLSQQTQQPKRWLMRPIGYAEPRPLFPWQNIPSHADPEYSVQFPELQLPAPDLDHPGSVTLPEAPPDFSSIFRQPSYMKYKLASLNMKFWENLLVDDSKAAGKFWGQMLELDPTFALASKSEAKGMGATFLQFLKDRNLLDGDSEASRKFWRYMLDEQFGSSHPVSAPSQGEKDAPAQLAAAEKAVTNVLAVQGTLREAKVEFDAQSAELSAARFDRLETEREVEAAKAAAEADELSLGVEPKTLKKLAAARLRHSHFERLAAKTERTIASMERKVQEAVQAAEANLALANVMIFAETPPLSL